jgi:hypothetical protein
MARSRLAFAYALTARKDQSIEVVESYSRGRGRPVPFLDARDRLFLAWSLFLLNESERARAFLDPAEASFRRHGLSPGSSLATWIRAEGHLLQGELELARKTLATGGGPANDLTAVLWPLLEGRILLQIGEAPEGRTVAADRLAEAGSALVGMRLPEWELRVAYLRDLLVEPTAERRGELEQQREELARELPPEARAGYLESAHWKAWTPALGLGISLRAETRRR